MRGRRMDGIARAVNWIPIPMWTPVAYDYSTLVKRIPIGVHHGSGCGDGCGDNDTGRRWALNINGASYATSKGYESDEQ
jgi:hypothetical protein